MKQILLIALSCIIYFTSNAAILIANCPQVQTNSSGEITCIEAPNNWLTIDLKLEGGLPPGFNSNWKVDFCTNINTFYNIPAGGLAGGGMSFVTNKGSHDYYLFAAYLKNPLGQIVQQLANGNSTGNQMYADICEPCTNCKYSSNNSLKDKIAPQNIFYSNQNIQADVKVFPNPFVDHFNVEYYFEDSNQATIEIFDINGVLIHKKSYTNAKQGILREKFNLNISSGLYFARITTGAKVDNLTLTKL